MSKASDVTGQEPRHCQYAAGPCDQTFRAQIGREAFFIYPSTPAVIAQTVREAIRGLQQYSASEQWLSWEGLPISGQIVFCEICKAIRSSRYVVANITTLNFNVLFEIGYAIGLGKPVLPVRDTSYEKDKRLFDEVGIFDVLGYADFANSIELAGVVQNKRDVSPVVHVSPDRNRSQPIYYLRAPVETDGSIRIFSELKKSSCPFRTFDSRETPRLSIHEAHRQVLSSTGIVAHLIDPDRTGALAHNARCAFVCGLAMAAERFVLMLQEGMTLQPIDYRDVIVPYEDVSVIPYAVSRIVRVTAELLYATPATARSTPQRLLDRLDLGDVAAENEIQALSSYFVRTPQFIQARQGHARLVIGRKGSGKTALFYGLRKAVSSGRKSLVLDLKPEGHQFAKLRETVLARMSEGVQQHTLTAFWHYLILIEVARRVVEREALTAWRDPGSLEDFKALQSRLAEHSAEADTGDFSERLMALVNRLVAALGDCSQHALAAPALTATIYRGDITELRDLVIRRQSSVGDLWILFDNIDKGFPTHGLGREDALIVRCLLEATRKLQRELQKSHVDCHAVIFVRRDVYDLLVEHTPDRGKESHVDLDWSDEDLMRQLILRRVQASVPELTGDFAEIWHRLFEAHVGGESSFRYILNRTLLRPRDLLNFVRKSVQVSASRSQDRVRETDIHVAEAAYSEDMFNELKYELRDVFPTFAEVLPRFVGQQSALSEDDIDMLCVDAGVPEERWSELLNALLWFCFLGIMTKDSPVYAYDLGYSGDRMNALVRSVPSAAKQYVVHPAFRGALMMKEENR